MEMTPTGAQPRMGEREFILFIALLSAMSALAIDMVLPAFEQMRPAFGLDSDSTELSLTITLFFTGLGVGTLFYGPISDSVGRKPTLAASMGLYALAALAAALAPTLGVLYASRFVWGLASAGPRTVSQAIVRDRFAGTSMARVMTLIQTVFFLAPICAPVLGKALVEVSSWRWVMAFGVVNALAVLAWSVRLTETLDRAHRRALRLGSVLVGFRFVVSNRTTLGYTLAVTFGFGAFLSFLSSTELIFVDVYDRSGWFVPYFSTVSVISAMAALGSSRLLRFVPARQLAIVAGFAFTLASAALFAVTAAAGGLPPLGLWLVLFTLANASQVAFFPSGVSLALEPMGALAGTAAAVLGGSGALVGSSLASFTDRAIDGSVMPIGVAYLVYSSIALGCQLWARGPSHGRGERWK